MSDYAQGSVSITSAGELVCLVAPENDGVLIANTGSATVYLGGSTVTASGATQGLPLAANTTLLVPALGSVVHSLFAITATGTSTVNFLYPAV